MRSVSRSQTLQELRQQLLKNHNAAVTHQVVPTGLTGVDTILPQGGLPTASVVEWISEVPGISAGSVALQCAKAYLSLPGCLAVVDSRREFHPDVFPALGLPFTRLLLIRPPERSEVSALRPVISPGRRNSASASASGRNQSQSQLLWALEQTARCSGVRIVVCWLDHASSTALRRLQLAVERSGSTVFLIRSASALKQPAWADFRFHLSPAVRTPSSAMTPSPARLAVSAPVSAAPGTRLPFPRSCLLTLKIAHTRAAFSHHASTLLRVSYETGAVREISELAGAASASTAADNSADRCS